MLTGVGTATIGLESTTNWLVALLLTALAVGLLKILGLAVKSE
ncbi:MAG: hypothetical protein ACRD0C_03060 [Acidimicrobiia bacterium]